MSTHPTALPRRVPRGVSASLTALLGLRRYGAAMRQALQLDEQTSLGARAQTARTQGMEYAESRPYSPGDDVRRFDWRVTARTGRAHTKVFRMERGKDLFCLVDQRRSMRFGTRAAFKSVVAAELAVLAGWAAAAGGDRFGAMVAGLDERPIAVGPAESSVATLCSAIAAMPPIEEGSDPQAPLEALAARAASHVERGTHFLIASDFADPALSLSRAIELLRARGTLILLWVIDPLEECLPPAGRYPFTDGRTQIVLDTAASAVRAAHSREFAERRDLLARAASEPGTRCCLVRTGAELFSALERRFGETRPK